MSPTDIIFAILELIFLYIIAYIFGEIVSRSLPFIQRKCSSTNKEQKSSYLRLPPLLGMLIAGILIANIESNFLLQHIPSRWSSIIRKAALTIILIRAGLGLDIVSLRSKSATTLRLATIPCLTEALVITLLVRAFKPDIDWAFAVTLGFVLSAVSPAVVVPSLLELQELGYGIDKGIPSMVLAAASLDDVLAICGFGISLGIAFSAGSGTIIRAAIDGPISIFGGLIVGIFVGWLLGNIHQFGPNDSEQNVVDKKRVNGIRFFMLLVMSMIIVFVSSEYGYAGGGYLATMVCGCVCAQYWKKNKEFVANMFKKVWNFMQVALFMLIGAEIDLSVINGNDLGIIVAMLCISLTIRLFVTFFVSMRSGLSINERLFVAVAWFPKATVQAAVGSTVLDRAMDEGKDEFVEIGQFILTAAVLSIVISAPIGAVGIFLSGPKWLKKTEKCKNKNEEIEEKEVEEEDTIEIEWEHKTQSQMECASLTADL